MTSRKLSAGFRGGITHLVITFNQPAARRRRFAAALWSRLPWDCRDPRTTGELLLAALKENA